MSEPKIRMRKSRLFDLQRKVVSHMVSESWNNIPHVSYLYEPDITDFYEEFKALSQTKAGTGKKLSINTIMIRVIVEGLKAAPDLNAFIEYNHEKGEGTLQVCDDINVSAPWLLQDGRMITPAILHTESITLDELSDAVSKLDKKIENTDIDELLYSAVSANTLKELRSFHLGIIRRIIAAKISFHRIKGLSGKEKGNYYRTSENDRLTEQNLTSGTVTISNIGSLYKEQKGYFGILEIIPPQIFAVGLGAIQDKPAYMLIKKVIKRSAFARSFPCV